MPFLRMFFGNSINCNGCEKPTFLWFRKRFLFQLINKVPSPPQSYIGKTGLTRLIFAC